MKGDECVVQNGINCLALMVFFNEMDGNCKIIVCVLVVTRNEKVKHCN